MLSSHEATATVNCTVPNCANEAVGRAGRFAGLCSEHIQIAARQDRGAQPSRQARLRVAPGPTDDSYEGRAKRLRDLGRQADTLRRRAEALAAQAEETGRAADEAESAFQQAVREFGGAA